MQYFKIKHFSFHIFSFSYNFPLHTYFIYIFSSFNTFIHSFSHFPLLLTPSPLSFLFALFSPTSPFHRRLPSLAISLPIINTSSSLVVTAGAPTLTSHSHLLASPSHTLLSPSPRQYLLSLRLFHSLPSTSINLLSSQRFTLHCLSSRTHFSTNMSLVTFFCLLVFVFIFFFSHSLFFLSFFLFLLFPFF